MPGASFALVPRPAVISSNRGNQRHLPLASYRVDYRPATPGCRAVCIHDSNTTAKPRSR